MMLLFLLVIAWAEDPPENVVKWINSIESE